MSGAVKTAGERRHDKFIFICWGEGEGNWKDQKQGPKMLKALDEQNIKYTCKLYPYSAHGSVHRLFPQVLKTQLGIYLGVLDPNTLGENTETDQQKATYIANCFKHTSAAAEGSRPIKEEHTTEVKALPFVTKFAD
jgi:hypothetical protein